MRDELGDVSKYPGVCQTDHDGPRLSVAEGSDNVDLVMSQRILVLESRSLTSLKPMLIKGISMSGLPQPT